MARHLKSSHQLQKNEDDEDVEDIEQTVESKEFTEADQAMSISNSMLITILFFSFLIV